jgi:hypothetical protein
VRISRAEILIAICGIVSVLVAFAVATWADSPMRDLSLNLMAGIATSVLFFFLLVWAPTQAKRVRIRKSAINYYLEFKVDVIGILLHASGKGFSDDERQALANDPQAFWKYFREDETGSGMRWYEVLNGLDGYHVSQIAMELEALRAEIQFVLHTLDIEDEELFAFMKRLSKICFLMTKRSADYDDVKMWGRFLWGIFSDWDPAVGRVGHDRNLEMLKRI